jgi:Skp family chaperone for outer membrane proteins
MTPDVAIVEEWVMSVLVVDVSRILDDSRAGRAAAQQLQARYDNARAAVDKLASRGSTSSGRARSVEAAGEFEANERAAIEAERVRLRSELLARARPIIEAIAKERGADVVVDAAAVITCAANVDVTDEVLRRLDA